MCVRKIYIHHRCGHKITELLDRCGNVECKKVKDKPVVTNKYTCVQIHCEFYGQF